MHQTHEAPAAAVPGCGGDRRELTHNLHTAAKPLRPVAPHIANAYKYHPSHRLPPLGLVGSYSCIAALTGIRVHAGGHPRHAAKRAIKPQPNSRPNCTHTRTNAKPNATGTTLPKAKIFNPSAGEQLRLFGGHRLSSGLPAAAGGSCGNKCRPIGANRLQAKGRQCRKPSARPNTSPSGMSAALAASPHCGYGVRPPCV